MKGAIPVVAILALEIACDRTGFVPAADCGRAGTACATHADCCSFACDGTCICAPRGEHCLADSACCAGNVCIDEMCVEGCPAGDPSCTTTDGAMCRELDEQCSTSDPCCSGLSCDNGSCTDRQCSAEGQDCVNNINCCDDLVCYDATSRCGPCVAVGAACSGADDCCGLSGCQSGACCHPPTDPCTVESDCCIVMFGTVVDARCSSQNRCCHATSSRCEANTDCCSGGCTAGLCDCMPLGGECQDVFDCCAGVCNGGKCCIGNGQVCNVNTDCCSGTCKANKTCM